jgi:AcrR family transcriptional regulator
MAETESGTGLTRKERERLAHRQEILEAAERVFARNGYHGATVEQIAGEAEFAVGTMYNFFRGKEELYEEVLAGLAEEFMGAFREQVVSQEDPVAAIGALIELRLTMFEKHRGFARTFFESMMGGHVDVAMGLPERMQSLYQEGVKAVTGIFERGIQAGRFVNVDPLYLTLCLHGVMNAFLAYWSRVEPEESLETRVVKFKEMFIGRLLRGDA